MKMQTIRELGERTGVNPGKMSKAELVRAIQKAEGNADCYATRWRGECNQSNCLWREDCMKASLA